jgi:hypothetical protein
VFKFENVQKFQVYRNLSLVALAIASLTACTKSSNSSARQGIQPQPTVAAAANIQDSMGSAQEASALPANLSSANSGDLDELLIQKSALDKEFLFSGSVIPQTQAATSQGIVGRVVMFRREGTKVYMLEATQGLVVSPTLPSTLILAAFPILSETTSTLVIDFNKGMDQIFTDQGMYASDETGLSFQETQDAEAIRASYLESVQTLGNILEIRQAAQVPEPAPIPSGAPAGTPAGLTFTNYEFRYYLQPYQPNPNFTPIEVKPADFQHVGFFEVNPVIEPITGRSVTRVAMRDLSKPVVYAISANTPPQYHDAVKNGILYWNKVFGREVVQAIDAPTGVTAPDPRYNIIQWVENDDAGFAYADVLTDPRSGEILHSQVYLTSVFGTATLQEMPEVVREYQPTAPSSLFSKGLLASTRVCDRGVDPDAAKELLAVKAQAPLDQAAYSKVVNNYIQFVVTHEVGHTLGLRHNFAGSLASTATPDATDQMFGDYVLKGTIPAQGQLFSSSVMDYNVLSEDVLHTAMFNAQDLVLPYDKLAINWAYANKPIDVTQSLPPFCTDTQQGSIADCLTFDRGAKPIVANQQAINKTLRLLGFSLAETYIAAKAPADPRDAMAINQVPIDPDASVKTLMASLTSQLSWVKSGGNQSIAIMNTFPFLTDFFKTDIIDSTDDSVAGQFAEAGGVNAVLLPFVSDKLNPTTGITASASAELSAYLQRSDVRNGLGANGAAYSLSDADISLIETNGKKFFQEIEDRTFDQSLDALGKATYTNKKLAPDLEKMLGDVAEQILVTKGDQVIAPAQTPPAATAAAAAPTSQQPAYAFTFTEHQRLAASQLLSLSLGGNDNEWEVSEGAKITKELTDYLTSVMGQDPTKVDASTLSQPLQGWFLDQMKVLKSVGDAGNQ